MPHISNTRASNTPLCAHVGDCSSEETCRLKGLGVATFIFSSDRGLLRGVGAQTLAAFEKV